LMTLVTFKALKSRFSSRKPVHVTVIVSNTMVGLYKSIAY